ncbi:hypothetical protein AQJ91_10620 [Streptomyces dysideae]|uniref:Uncharacterized protein n=1 Tax=Streptomyces dysideae TaxID=909626 RepID=A0A101V262_9ACTN|nr:hypothetical protein [Streptomyces dysideae]KUO21087.1 hypothetical protein AQJ91_10620 [Streptomyces dysideae]
MPDAIPVSAGATPAVAAVPGGTKQMPMPTPATPDGPRTESRKPPSTVIAAANPAVPSSAPATSSTPDPYRPTVRAAITEPATREPAFPRDRTLVNEGRERVYGTQIAGVRDDSPVAAYTAQHKPA